MHYRFWIAVLLLAVCIAGTLYAHKASSLDASNEFLVDPDAPLPTILPVPERLDLTAEAIVELHGPPLFALSNILVYSGSFAELPADITFFLVSEQLSEMSFSFPTEGTSTPVLRRHADRVLKRLRVLYGPPGSRSYDTGQYKTHLWRSPDGELIHTVVYTAERPEHVLRAVRTRETR